MTILRSRENPRIRHWRRLIADRHTRRRTRRAWIEGTRLIAAFLDAGGIPVALILNAQTAESPDVTRLVTRAGVAPVLLSKSVFAELADTETPQGIAAEIEIPDPALESGDVAQCVFLDGIRDPGNLGSILRSASAFGVQEMVLGGCADPWAPKVLRAAMGAHFALRIRETPDLPGRFAAFPGQRICTVPRGGTPVQDLDLSVRHAWAFGGEALGVRAELAMVATQQAYIPMAQAAESLNVAIAAAICLYEAARQRRLARPRQ